MTEAMKKLHKSHGSVISEIWDDILRPILNEQQRISFGKEDLIDGQAKMIGYNVAYRCLEKIAQEHKKEENKK